MISGWLKSIPQIQLLPVRRKQSRRKRRGRPRRWKSSRRKYARSRCHRDIRSAVGVNTSPPMPVIEESRTFACGELSRDTAAVATNHLGRSATLKVSLCFATRMKQKREYLFHPIAVARQFRTSKGPPSWAPDGNPMCTPYTDGRPHSMTKAP